MSLGIGPTYNDYQATSKSGNNRPLDPAAMPFSQALTQAKAVESVPPSAFSFQSQFNQKKKRIEGIEKEREYLDEEESVYKTAQELVNKIQQLAELERKGLGL